jgi:hypothetical protein
MPSPSRHEPRRSFLSRATLALLAVPRILRGEELPQPPDVDDPDAWLRGLDAPHRLFQDMPDFAGGLPALHTLNYLNTYRSAHGVEATSLNVVVGLWSRTTLLAVNDAMWATHRIGEFLDLRDAAGQPFTRNPWRTSVFALGADRPAAGIEALQARGVRHIVCNNALTLFTQLLATARSADPAALGAELRANLLPGVTLVSAMVIAIERAQAHGFAYMRE